MSKHSDMFFTIELLEIAFPNVPKELKKALQLIDKLRDGSCFENFYEYKFANIDLKVGANPANSRFDPEVIELIMFQIDDITDLVEFALCSRAFAAVYTDMIYEKQFDFRQIPYRGLNLRRLTCDTTAVNQQLRSGATLVIDDNIFLYRNENIHVTITPGGFSALCGSTYIHIYGGALTVCNESASAQTYLVNKENAGSLWPILKYIRKHILYIKDEITY